MSCGSPHEWDRNGSPRDARRAKAVLRPLRMSSSPRFACPARRAADLAQSHLAERFVARPLGARDERWVGSDWMIPSVVGLISAMLMIGAASAAPASDPSYLGNWARADGKTHIRVEPCGKSVWGVNTWVRPGISTKRLVIGLF